MASRRIFLRIAVVAVALLSSPMIGTGDSESPWGCPRPDEGCACDPGEEPIDCFVGPSDSPGERSCGFGTRYCRGGSWSACENVRFTQIRSRNALIAPGFKGCDPYDPSLGSLGCDPDCYVASDSPDPWDLNDTNSDEHLYRSSELTDAPGVYLDHSGDVAALDDADGDGIPDLADDCESAGGAPGRGGRFGCADGDGWGVYAEHTPGTQKNTLLAALTPPPPPLDLYVLADLAVVVITVDILIWEWNFRLTMDEPVAHLGNNAAQFTNIISQAYTDLGAAPDVRYGVGYFNEYQMWTQYGDPSGRARPFEHHLNFTASGATFGSSLRSLAPPPTPPQEARGTGNFGNILGLITGSWDADVWLEVDGGITIIPPALYINRFELLSPESHTQALWSIATNNGLPWGRNWTAPGGACPTGQWGYPCFRAGALPVIAVITDDVMHNGPNGPSPRGQYPYNAVSDVRNLAGAFPLTGGNGSPSNPRVIPGTVNGQWRLFTGGNTNTVHYNARPGGCGSWNWDASDETIQFTVTETGPVRIRVERTNNWGGNTHFALLRAPTGDAVAGSCVGFGSTHDQTFNLTPGTYYLRFDGSQVNPYCQSNCPWPFGGSCCNWNDGHHHRGAYQIYIGTSPNTNWNGVSYATEVLPALTANGVKVVGLHGCSLGTISFFGWTPPCHAVSAARSQLASLAAATGGVFDNGQPIVPSMNVGSGADATRLLAEGIAGLVKDVPQRVEFIARDNPSTAIDERHFIRNMTLAAPGCTETICTPNGLGSMVCQGCNSKDMMRLNVETHYDPSLYPHPPQTSEAQLFEFEIDVEVVRTVGINSSRTTLMTIPVRIVIPPDVQLSPGTYTRNYDATVFDPSLPDGAPICEIGGETGLRPDWLSLSWTSLTPSNTSGPSFIEFNLTSADDDAGLESGASVCFRVPENAPSKPNCPRYAADGVDAFVDVGEALVAQGWMNYQHLLRVTATLHPTPDGQLGPTLYEMDLKYACTPFE